MKRVVFVIILLTYVFSSVASSLQAGAVFLMIFPGSRATSMGGAFGAAEGDAFSTFYNNAALAFEDKAMLGLQHANWLPGLYPGMYYEYLSFLYPFGKDINLTGAVTYLTTGETQANIDGMEREWITYDVAVKIAGCMPISDKIGVSLGMKYIYSFLAPEDVVELLGREYGGMQGGTGHAWALDGSIFFRWADLVDMEYLNMQWFDVLRLGLAIQNIGPEISYIEGGNSDPLPRTVRIGTSLDIFESDIHKMGLNLDLIKIIVGISDYTDFSGMLEDTWKAAGMEYTFNEIFSLRFGYFIDRLGKRQGPTFGAGFGYKTFHFDLSVDEQIYEFKTSNYRLSAQYSF